MTPDTVGLAALVGLAFFVQGCVGFGGMLTCLTLGAQWFAIDTLLPQLVPLSMVQAVLLLGRYGGVERALLLRRVLPLATVGLALGIGLRAFVTVDLRPALGVLVLGLALRELVPGAPAGAPSAVARQAAFLASGLLQGLFGTGGPPMVWGLASEGLAKGAFRASLVAVLLYLNTGVMLGFLLQGALDAASLGGTALLLGPMALGTWLGDRLHHRVDEARFKTAVWALLAAGAVSLVARAL